MAGQDPNERADRASQRRLLKERDMSQTKIEVMYTRKELEDIACSEFLKGKPVRGEDYEAKYLWVDGVAGHRLYVNITFNEGVRF